MADAEERGALRIEEKDGALGNERRAKDGGSRKGRLREMGAAEWRAGSGSG
jgi:hypothetical protein